MGSQHPSHRSPNVKTFCKFELQIWPEIITSRDAESTCFKGSRTSGDVIGFGIFWPNFGRKRSHHVMDMLPADVRSQRFRTGMSAKDFNPESLRRFSESSMAPTSSVNSCISCIPFFSKSLH